MNVVLGIADGNIKIWEMLDNDVMINQLQIRKKHHYKLIEKIRSSGRKVWIDSGGYQIMVKGLDISAMDVLEKYMRIDADFFMSLDTPIFEYRSDVEEVIKENIKNFEYLYSRLDDKNVIPVVHLYPGNMLIETVEKYREYNPKIVAYGGIVPPVLRKTRYRLKSLVGLLILKKAFPDLRIHVLGIGSHIMISILKKLGVYSLDTSTWRVKAAYGHVILPGNGERYVGTRNIRFRTPLATSEDISLLYRSLRDSGFPFLDRFNELLGSFRGRAIINAWIISKIDTGISRKSPFYKLYKKIKELRNYSLDELLRIYDGVSQNDK